MDASRHPDDAEDIVAEAVAFDYRSLAEPGGFVLRAVGNLWEHNRQRKPEARVLGLA